MEEYRPNVSALANGLSEMGWPPEGAGNAVTNCLTVSSLSVVFARCVSHDDIARCVSHDDIARCVSHDDIAIRRWFCVQTTREARAGTYLSNGTNSFHWTWEMRKDLRYSDGGCASAVRRT